MNDILGCRFSATVFAGSPVVFAALEHNLVRRIIGQGIGPRCDRLNVVLEFENLLHVVALAGLGGLEQRLEYGLGEDRCLGYGIQNHERILVFRQVERNMIVAIVCNGLDVFPVVVVGCWQDRIHLEGVNNIFSRDFFAIVPLGLRI